MRERVELVTRITYFSDDGWETVWKETSPKHVRRVTNRDELAKARMLAVFKYGGGRDDEPRRA